MRIIFLASAGNKVGNKVGANFLWELQSAFSSDHSTGKACYQDH